MKQLWRPMADLADRYDGNIMLRAPELVDLDCNEHGVAPGFWQDEPDHPAGGEWIAAAYDMNDDEWVRRVVNPTHFLLIEGPEPFTDEEVDAANEAGRQRYLDRMHVMQAPAVAAQDFYWDETSTDCPGNGTCLVRIADAEHGRDQEWVLDVWFPDDETRDKLLTPIQFAVARALG